MPPRLHSVGPARAYRWMTKIQPHGAELHYLSHRVRRSDVSRGAGRIAEPMEELVCGR